MTRVGSVYGEALYDLTHSEGCDEAVLRELLVLGESFGQEPDFLRLMTAANVPKEERCAVLDGCFRDKVHPYVLNFMKILAEKGYFKNFSQCVQSYREHYNRDHGILEVKAVSAVALTDAQQQRLKEKLHSITGKTIELVCSVDPQCLGGMRLDYDGRRVEDTLRQRLDTLGDLLKNTAV